MDDIFRGVALGVIVGMVISLIVGMVVSLILIISVKPDQRFIPVEPCAEQLDEARTEDEACVHWYDDGEFIIGPLWLKPSEVSE